MKRGITVEFDYKDDGYWVRKQKGQLTIPEIVDAMIDEGVEGFLFIGINTECIYDDSGYISEKPVGDSVKVYEWGTCKRLLGGDRP